MRDEAAAGPVMNSVRDIVAFHFTVKYNLRYLNFSRNAPLWQPSYTSPFTLGFLWGEAARLHEAQTKLWSR